MTPPNLALSVGVACADPLVADLIASELRHAEMRACVIEADQIAGDKPLDIETDVVLLDTRLMDGSGELLHHFLRSAARVLVLGRAGSPAVISGLMSGASGAVDIAETTSKALTRAVKQVARGEAALHPAVAAAILDQWRSGQSAPAPRPDVALTVRERDVLELMGRGHSAREAARRLGLSLKTIESHKSRIYDKLGVRGQSAAVRRAVERGLISIDSP